MDIVRDYDLTNLNTFHIKAKAKFFAEVKSEQDLVELIKTPEFKNNEKLFLGGGSNVLFTKDFDGFVVLNKIKGIEIIKQDANYVFVKSMGGENWHDLVLFSVGENLWGIENLALIHGTVGAAPMQNIGAYGTEIKDSLDSVEVLEINTGEKKVFSKEECKLGYRDSIFKNELKGRYFILAVVFKLSKNPKPNLTYQGLKNYLEENSEGKSTSYEAGKIEVKSSKDISDAVAEIRKSKLPDPKILGNAGSFFKNVYVKDNELKNLLEKYPEMPYFEEPADSQAVLAGRDQQIKIPAGWLIEQCGWKGKRVGNVGVHDKQALVLVNYGEAKGEEIKNLAEQIIDSVFKKFGLKLSPEVNLI